ncbi:ROK family protein [Streptococcus ratti]|uniref:Transcriptional regulator n=1 Tax=Streptococcus ratti FA-1 = DSM 20564 TaxID=699248 RepID=A0ABN0GTC7_STRRT|nr:ROK family protein [Streptococcus ratti]EJN93420.1 transcriptional regulator [Streptococcus ratti FA-1 = DSM 20564]EMP69480.1 hypothetical protein D822_07883 [Streptococcus ratti FA-1 = DSM 20564]QEY07309.1 ROK family protein [Streptococcus ratti]VEI59746.1 transcriptional regulator [Streptococcus mutans]
MTILALDFGGTQLKSALISDDLEKIDPLPIQASPQDMESCLTLIDSIVTPHLAKIAGIAVSAPGTVDSEKGIIYYGGVLRFLHEFHVKSVLEAKYGKPVAAINDGKAAALAELAKGNLKGIQNGLALILGTGLGGGIIINGQLYQGSHFQAGELTFLLPDKEKNQIGDMKGIQVSAVGLIEKIAEVLKLADKQDGRAAFHYIEQKDARIYSLFETYCRHVAHLILNLQTILDVECCVIGGGISTQPVLLEEINRQFDLLHAQVDPVRLIVERPQILACQFFNDANLLGAAYFLTKSV